MRRRNVLAALVLLGAGSAAVAADPAAICADRPGKATATCSVPAGHLQIETGLADWTLEKAAGGRDTSLVLGETTMKYGLTGASDIEVDVAPWQRAAGARGIGDV